MMLRRLAGLAVLATFCLAICSETCSARDEKANPAAVPINRDNGRHKEFLKKVAKGDAQVVFIGDSITEGWEGNGRKVWIENYADIKALNLGIGGDRTGHILWRITEGKELEPISPKLAVMMIGTNNMGEYSAEQIAGGVTAIIKELHKQKPEMKILLLGIFPRSAKPTDAVREKIKTTNAIISKLDDGKTVFYKDIGEKFLEPDGSLSKKIMPDYLHLSQDGYIIWADNIRADIEKLLKK